MTPIALCTPAKSTFAGMKEMVASPGVPPGTIGGIKNRMIESGFLSEKGRKLCTMAGLKYLKFRIRFAAPGSASMVVTGELGSNWRNVSSWQWSGFSCEMSTTLGSGISDKCRIEDWTVCFDKRNLGCHMVLCPESHGSTRIVKLPCGACC